MHYVNQKLKNFPFFASVSFPRKLQLDDQNLQKINSLFTEIQEENLQKNLMQKESILALITRIYIQSIRLFSKDQQLLNSGSVFHIFRHYQEFESLLEETFPGAEVQLLLCRFVGNYGEAS